MYALICTGLVLLVTTSQALPQKLNVASGNGKTEFVAIGRPTMLKIHGESSGPSGDLMLDGGRLTGRLTLDLKSLTTKMSLRDEHMKGKYLQVERYPNAELAITDLKLPDGETQEIDFTGRLKLHGVEKPVKTHADIKTTKTGYEVKARFEIRLSDYAIEIPTHLGVKVADNVEVTVDFRVAR